MKVPTAYVVLFSICILTGFSRTSAKSIDEDQANKNSQESSSGESGESGQIESGYESDKSFTRKAVSSTGKQNMVSSGPKEAVRGREKESGSDSKDDKKKSDKEKEKVADKKSAIKTIPDSNPMASSKVKNKINHKSYESDLDSSREVEDKKKSYLYDSETGREYDSDTMNLKLKLIDSAPHQSSNDNNIKKTGSSKHDLKKSGSPKSDLMGSALSKPALTKSGSLKFDLKTSGSSQSDSNKSGSSQSDLNKSDSSESEESFADDKEKAEMRNEKNTIVADDVKPPASGDSKDSISDVESNRRKLDFMNRIKSHETGNETATAASQEKIRQEPNGNSPLWEAQSEADAELLKGPRHRPSKANRGRRGNNTACPLKAEKLYSFAAVVLVYAAQGSN